MIKFWSICRNTFVQTIRQPIYCVLLSATFGVLVMTLPLTGWTLGGSEDYHATDQKMLENLGVSTLLISGLLLAAFSASAVVTREIEEKTALTVISKPVSRATFVLGKFVGVAGAVTVSYYLCSLVLLMTVRHRVMSAVSDPYDVPVIVLGLTALGMTLLISLLGNYFFGWVFTSSSVWTALVCFSIATGLIGFIGKEWEIVPFGQDIRPQLLIGMVLIFLGVMVFTAVAVTASTRLSPVLTLLVCFAVLCVGWTYPRLFGPYADKVPVVRLLSWMVPNLTFLDPQDPMTTGKDIPLRYVGMAAGYCACYVVGVLAVGVALFQRRPLEASAASATVPGAVAVLAWIGRIVAVGGVIAGGILLSLKQYHNPTGFAVSGGLLVGGLATWILWGCFSRGMRWSYWFVLVVVGLLTMRGLVGLISAQGREVLMFGTDKAPIFVQTALALAVLIVLFFPKTHRHFTSTQEQRRLL